VGPIVRFQTGKGLRWSAPEGPFFARGRLRRTIRRQVSTRPIRWRLAGWKDWRQARWPWLAAARIVRHAKGVSGRVAYQVQGGPRLRRLEGQVPDAGYIPWAAKLTLGTRRTVAFFAEIHLVFPKLRNLGIYNPRTLRYDSSYWSEHAWAAAADCGVDNQEGTGFATDPNRIALNLEALTRYVLANFSRLGVAQHIYNSQQYLASGTGYVKRPYTASDPHETHTHTAFANHDGAKPPWIR
jgi:hypothetical protein